MAGPGFGWWPTQARYWLEWEDDAVQRGLLIVRSRSVPTTKTALRGPTRHYAILGGMKWLFFIFLPVTLYAQRTLSIPVIVVHQGESAVWVKVSDLKVDIDSTPTTIVSLTPLAAAHLQYVLLNDQSGKSFWPGGISQQVDVASQFLEQVIVPGADSGSLVNFNDEVFLDVKSETDSHKILAHLARQ